VPLGIGDLIYLQAQLKEIEHKFDKIYISPNGAIINKFGGTAAENSKRLEFTKSFFNLIFDKRIKNTKRPI